MKRILSVIALSVPFLASAAPNLLTNGSFESGFSGWTVAGGGVYPPAVVQYGTTASTFGESIPAASDVSLSPDAVGSFAAYFVDDNSLQTLTQTFTVNTAGVYAVGFDLYKLLNGASNPGDAAFSAKVDSASIFSASASAVPVTTWQAQTGNVLLSAGSHSVTFTFATTGGQSKDLAIDRVYVTAVPEPGSISLMLAGMGAVGLMVRRRRA